MSNIKSGFSSEIIAAITTVDIAGRHIQTGTWSTDLQIKPVADFECGSVTEADTMSQNLILSTLLASFPSALFIAEEGAANQDHVAILEAPLVFFVDPLCGTTEKGRGLPLWVVSIGVMRYGQHVGGAIFAPDVFNGFLIAGERGRGVRSWRGLQDPKAAFHTTLSNAQQQKPIVAFGLDVLRSGDFDLFLTKLPHHLRPRWLAPSCGLPLGLLAIGAIDVFVQSAQLPWDWAAGIPLVEETGGRVIFFRKKEPVGIEVVSTLDQSCYVTNKHSVGFLAGKPKLVEEMLYILQEST